MNRMQRLRQFSACLIFGAGVVCAGGLSVAPANAQRLMPQAQASPCDAIRPRAAVEFHGKMLQETPDISNADLVLLNTLISTRDCRSVATTRLSAYRKAHPDDYQSNFLVGRLLWLDSQQRAAMSLLARTLSEHADFTSAKLLLGAMALERQDFATARSLLEQVLSASPNDLWANLNMLQVDAGEKQSAEAASRLLEIARNDKFAGFPREAAAVTVMRMESLPLDMRERAYRVQLEFASATPISMKTENLGRFLIEERKDYAAGQKLLKSYLATDSEDEYAKVLLAESYLLQAVAVAPTPTVDNAALIAQAKAVFDGDLSPLAARIAEYPNLRKLQPLTAGSVFDPDATDQFGRTALCNSLLQLNVSGVASALEAGANPDGKCADNGIIYLLLEPSVDYARTSAILELLLKRGVDVDTGRPIPRTTMVGSSPIEVCQADPACREKLMPLLKKYSHATK